ncbi:MAG TPA: hypothetical protein VJN70_10850 [Gemmatimonadaceae bacterium]|nr:hypothetical protein [Gemmatimonadaceae bacterium]
MSISRRVPEPSPIEPVTPSSTTDRHDRGDIEWTLHVRDRKLKFCVAAPGASSARGDGRAFDPAMRDAQAAVANYLIARVRIARGVPTRRLKLQAPILEQHAQRAIGQAVQILRTRGARPEYLLVQFKELIATLPRHDYDVWEDVRQQTSQWVIESYYE